MSFLKKVAGAFVELDTTEPKKPPKRTVTQPVIVTSGAIQEVAPSQSNIDTQVVNEFTEQFRKILEDENIRNHPGNDYFEFKVMKDAMSAISHEPIKYQAAFAGWSTGGKQTKETLLSTAKIYLGLVQKEITSFEQAYNQEYQSQVSGNEKVIEQKTAEVQQLVEKVGKLNQEVAQLKQQSLQNASELRVNHDAFMHAGQAQKDEILAEIEKINQYIN